MSFKVEHRIYDTEMDCDDYLITFELFYNDERVFLSEYVYFEDPYTYEELSIKDISLNNRYLDYIVEIPKSYFEDDDCDKIEIIEKYKYAFEKAYIKTLVKELGVYGIAYSLFKDKLKQSDDIRVFNEGEIDNFASNWEQSYEEMNLSELVKLTEDDVEKKIKDDL